MFLPLTFKFLCDLLWPIEWGGSGGMLVSSLGTRGLAYFQLLSGSFVIPAKRTCQGYPAGSGEGCETQGAEPSLNQQMSSQPPDL